MSRPTLWPYALITFFVLFIAGVVSFVVFSVHHSTDLVTRDYYEDELAFQDRIDATRRGQARGEGVRLEQQAGHVSVHFGQPLETPGRLKFYRPSDASMDFVVVLDKTGSPAYEVDTSELSPGLWRMQLTWTVHGEEHFREKVLVLTAAE